MTHYKQIYRSCTIKDYSMGVHEAWEVAIHEYAQAYQLKMGVCISSEDRINFIDNYLSTRNYWERTAPTTCHVCQETIAQALLTGRKAFEIPELIRVKLRELKAAIMPGRKRTYFDLISKNSSNAVTYNSSDSGLEDSSIHENGKLSSPID